MNGSPDGPQAGDDHDPGTVVRKDGTTGRPARGYSWPPFQPGHTLSVQHGAYSPRKVDPLAAEFVATVGDLDWVGPVDMPAVWAWARAEAQVQLLSEYLMAAAEAAGDGVGDLDLDRVRTAYLLLHRAEGRAQRGRESLGLTPLARSRLAVNVAATRVDLARLMSEVGDDNGGGS